MADYLGNIDKLPYTRLPDTNDGNPSFIRTRATKCDLFGNPPTEESIGFQSKPALDLQSLPSAIPPLTRQQETDNALIATQFNSDIQHLSKKLGNLFSKAKEKINAALPKTEDDIVRLVNRKWAFLINPNPEPTPQFPINFEDLTPKMKNKVLQLHEYAQKELGIKILVNDAARTKKQQLLVKNGAKCSPHVQKMAVDIHIDGKSIEEAQPYLKKLADYWKKITGGQGRWGGDWYGKQHDPWHFDLGTPVCA